VIDSRLSGNTIRRRRKCCDERWTTYEILAGKLPGVRAPLDRIALLEQQVEALEHALAAVGEFSTTVLRRVVKKRPVRKPVEPNGAIGRLWERGKGVRDD